MKLRPVSLIAALVCTHLLMGSVQAQGFVFGTDPAAAPAKPNTPAPLPAGQRTAKVETAQRLLARMGLLREAPSGNLTPATQEAIRSFAAQNGLPATSQVTDALLNSIRRVIWQTQKWSSGNYKGREKLVDAAGLREAQTLLGKLGFDPGPLDATFGPQTQVATEAFQESQQVTVDGLITATVLMNLRRAVQGVGAQAKATVRVLNWPDYIEPSVLQDFEKETGIRVIYDIFSGNDDLQDKLAAKGVPYDVVFPTANAVPAMAAKGLLGKLDKASLKNLGNIDPRVDATLRAWDKDGAYSLPYMWYTVGIAWNNRLAAKTPAMDTLANVFDPEAARRFQSCGVGVVDSASDVIPLAAMAAGVAKWDSKTSLAAAARVMDGIRGIVKVIPTDQFIDQLASGKVCVAIGFSGDAVQAQAKSRGTVEYRVPADGGLLAIDAIALAANAKNKREAHQFIDYILRPQVIAKISNTVGYANANLKAGEFMSDAIKSNPAVVPSPASLSRSAPIPILSEQDQQEIARIWSKFSK
ncbi:MAG: extracellular solute-binding protein [Rhodoferax sp.]|jgi:putrescine transport system substrate-binding protein|uniref:extracellular solute-binding protein n=1 Tax=Rhodoferax sp. TaxID=50421 RepID=UPI001B59CA5A|nr:extracellular solute-binding protein [Rhodoferax sp.]MBP8287571.1 extracellular solute-binding protein [Rhodoferax sp.]MBP9149373.1 extracellular solute-binding protein [Rhodoferax sp.]MBP9735841.1 extracellular solute-binding protein [Rhodoferax sp.]